MNEEIKDAKFKNIIEMAVEFSGLRRVFAKGSEKRIRERLYSCMGAILDSKTKEQLKKRHNEFCQWFTRNIMTAERKRNGKVITKSENASWGHAAKVFDIVLKVIICYCQLPTVDISAKLKPWLNCAIDTQVFKELKRTSKNSEILGICKLTDINEKRYEILQRILCNYIKEKYHGKLCPVQSDDILFRELNR